MARRLFGRRTDASGDRPTHQGLAQSVARYGRLCRWLSLLLLVLAAFLSARALPVGQTVDELRGWIEGLGAQGVLVFGLLFVGASILLMPVWPFSVAAGAVFGPLVGTFVVSLASTAAVAVTFLIARYVARKRVAGWVRRYPKFHAVDNAIAGEGWKIVALLRLSPALPFNLQNYLYGLTAVRFWPCVLASWAAMLPSTFLYVYFGYLGRASLAAAAEGETSTGLASWSLRIGGLVAAVAATVYVAQLARRAVRRQVAIEGSLPLPQMPAVPGGEALEPGSGEPPSPYGALAMLMTALLVLGFAGWTYANRGAIRSALEGHAGSPPQQRREDAPGPAAP